MVKFSNENRICLTSEVENAQLKKDHTQVCPICGETFIGYGNNPYPVAKDGLCCDDCNMLVIVMRCWLDSNHDWLKGLVDGLPLNEIAVTGHCYINGESVAFTFYKDELSKNLDVVVVCNNECIEKVVEGALQNWIANNCSDLDIKNVRAKSKVGVRAVTKKMKIEFELEADGKTECDEATAITSTANEIYERLEKVFENTDFQVNIDNSMPETDSTITISRMYNNSDEEILIDFCDKSDYCDVNIGGCYDGCSCCEESVRWNPENDDLDVVYKEIKYAVITVYAGITEYRMRKMFNEE